MHKMALVFFVITRILMAITKSTSSTKPTFSYTDCPNTDSTFAKHSEYQTNLNTVLKYLTSNSTNSTGFHATSAGNNTKATTVYGLFLCRGDLKPTVCKTCVETATTDLKKICPNKEVGYIRYDECFVRYSNVSILGRMEAEPAHLWVNAQNITGNFTKFEETMLNTMDKIAKKAANGGSKKKYATDIVVFTSLQTIYAMAQCTPDLSSMDCYQCLSAAIDMIPISLGGRTMVPSCMARYENYSYWNGASNSLLQPTPPPPPPTNSTSPVLGPPRVEKRRKSRTTTAIVVPMVGSLLLIIVVALIYIKLKKKKRKEQKKSSNNLYKEIETVQSLQYSLEAIKSATDDFSTINYLGKGGFGTVYKGMLPDGQEIAVKRLAWNSVQGNVQFKNEIMLLAKLQHRNLVRLLGFCLEGEEMLLIYEFVANSSLDKFLFDHLQVSCMSWQRRYNIIIGIARGLQYLHEDSRLRIIHRDLKAGNVLLDADFNPKIADFGMARLCTIDQSQEVASKIVGTHGYMAPEYVLHGQLSMKSDVYSFGVLVLETISNQRISSFQIGENPENLLTFAWKKWQEGKAWDVVDPTLSRTFSLEILRCIRIGLLCVQYTMAERPTMSEVDLMLTNASVSLQVPLQPAFFTQGHTPSYEPSVNEISITQSSPR